MAIPLQVTHSLEMGALVDLYEIDLLPIGINVQYRFTPSQADGQSLWFAGLEYSARAIEVTGFEVSAVDQPPEPTMHIANVDKGGSAIVAEYGDLLGAQVTRIRTFEQFLDKLGDGTPNPTADGNAKLFDEIWFIEQKTNASRYLIEWRLKSVMDLDGKQVPARKIVKNVCRRNYRAWDTVTGSFLYPAVNACPYAGAGMWDKDGNVTTNPLLDLCPKYLSACALRFPDEPLPTWAMPGVTRLPGG